MASSWGSSWGSSWWSSWGSLVSGDDEAPGSEIDVDVSVIPGTAVGRRIGAGHQPRRVDAVANGGRLYVSVEIYDGTASAGVHVSGASLSVVASILGGTATAERIAFYAGQANGKINGITDEEFQLLMMAA